MNTKTNNIRSYYKNKYEESLLPYNKSDNAYIK